MEAFTGSDLPAARLPYCGQGWQAGFRVTPNREPLNPHMKLHEIRCHFHEVSSSIKLAASAASGGAEP
jgi:hypothetical protein